MARGRISISTMMGAILACSVALAALRSANELWAGVLSLLTLGLLGVAALGVIYRRGRAQARWLGFIVFAGGYLVLVFGPWFSDRVGPRLATTMILGRLHPGGASTSRRVDPQDLYAQRDTLSLQLTQLEQKTRDPLDPSLTRPRKQLAVVNGQLTNLKMLQEHENLIDIGQCLLALASGLLGSIIAGRFCPERAMPSSDPTTRDNPDRDGLEAP